MSKRDTILPPAGRVRLCLLIGVARQEPRQYDARRSVAQHGGTDEQRSLSPNRHAVQMRAAKETYRQCKHHHTMRDSNAHHIQYAGIALFISQRTAYTFSSETASNSRK